MTAPCRNRDPSGGLPRVMLLCLALVPTRGGRQCQVANTNTPLHNTRPVTQERPMEGWSNTTIAHRERETRHRDREEKHAQPHNTHMYSSQSQKYAHTCCKIIACIVLQRVLDTYLNRGIEWTVCHCVCAETANLQCMHCGTHEHHVQIPHQ